MAKIFFMVHLGPIGKEGMEVKKTFRKEWRGPILPVGAKIGLTEFGLEVYDIDVYPTGHSLKGGEDPLYSKEESVDLWLEIDDGGRAGLKTLPDLWEDFATELKEKGWEDVTDTWPQS